MVTKQHLIKKLKRYAIIISSKRNEKPYSKFVALRKIFVQEKRVWPSGIQIGWKRGEVFEVLETLLKLDFEDFKKEWGDVGYYIASSYHILIWLYCLVTPSSIIKNAVDKFYGRAMK